MAVRQDSNSPKRVFKLMLRKRYADRFVSDAAVDRDAHQEGRRTPEQGYLAKLPASLNSYFLQFEIFKRYPTWNR
jgi:hypothetical protein